MKKVWVSHKGTIESIKTKKKNMKLSANYPRPNNFFTRQLLEDSRKVVWLKRGKVSVIDPLITGMHGENAKAWVEFQIDKKLLRMPNRFKFFMFFQRVVPHDIEIPEDAIFHIPEE
ncbi:hypothetical protein MKX57_09320 [Lysinibacillus sp. FSL M8-0216]|uniref:hypothetical protein n=1 Tax=Lysinibacillus sp. FSL M8-0216 TaxID=2921619 RepID=UPI00315B1EDC